MTIVYRVTEAPSKDRLADSWKYLYDRNQLTVQFDVERDHVQPGYEPRVVKFEMENCLVLGLVYTDAYLQLLTIEVKLYIPGNKPGRILHNATALIEFPRRKGTLELMNP